MIAGSLHPGYDTQKTFVSFIVGSYIIISIDDIIRVGVEKIITRTQCENTQKAKKSNYVSHIVSEE